MAHAINADHDAPLQFRIALQKALWVIGQRADHRNCKKHIHRDKHGDQIKPFGDHEPELRRQHHKKRQHQAAVVAMARG